MIAPWGSFTLKTLADETAVTVDRTRCVRHRCSANPCTKCMDACPAGSLSWDRGGLHIDANACTHCLACLAVCPTAALASPDPTLPELLADLAGHSLPVLGCKGHPDSDAHARLSCLGYLGHLEVMALCALVFPEGLQVNLTNCGGCPNGHVLDGVIAAYRQLNELVPGHAVRLIRKREELEFQPPSISRRQFFLFFRDRSTRAAAAMVERLQDDAEQQSYGKKQVPTTRALLLKAMVASSAAKSPTMIDQLFGKISFTSDCTRSKRCVGVCPTGAIRPSKNDGSPPIFDQTLCVSCQSCQAFCPNGGVLITGSTGTH